MQSRPLHQLSHPLRKRQRRDAGCIVPPPPRPSGTSLMMVASSLRTRNSSQTCTSRSTQVGESAHCLHTEEAMKLATNVSWAKSWPTAGAAAALIGLALPSSALA